MDCAGCGRANREGARFCGGCGRPLAPRCPKCGTETQPGAQFCDACGAALSVAKTPAAEARKVVTIVFADLIGSTALHERLDAESARRLMDRYHRAMSAAVEAQGGTVMQLLGDGVLAGFGVPRVAEDDAIRAVRAAVGMQQAFRELVADQAGLAGDIGLRVAVNTGEVVAGDDHTHVMGDPVNVAARLQQEARDGDVLLGESTQRLVAEKVTLASFGSFALKGRAEPVAAYRVVSLERPAGAPAIAFVGRDDELRRIRAVYDTAVATPAARLAVVLGSPGLGKSRLIDEFTRRLGDGATVLMAHCDAAGGATFAPLAEALRGLLRIDDGAGGEALRGAILSALPEGEPERTRIADGVAALVVGTPASPEEIFFVVRRGLAALAAARPVVLAIDDIQWAEPLLHDLIEHLVQWGSDVPLLVLAAARPELRDSRSSLATPGGLVGDVVTLAGLDAGAATKLAANAIGAAELPAAIAGRILATSEGNPLFVGELVRMLVHDGALKREGDRWTAGVSLEGLEMPPTIHALLAARIERLRPEERTVLERAAVIGRHFSRTALAQLLPREIGDLDAKLESLRRSELVEPDTGWFLGEPVLRFHHVLIRDAAYRRLLKNTRAELHGRFADWLEARAAGSVEHDETLGWHLEQAHQHLRELGPIDTQGQALGERAARRLAAAGRRALARDDLPPAASLLERALGLLDGDDPARADLALDWCEALLSAGDVGNAARAIGELARFIGDSERLRAWHTCFSGQLAVFTDPKALRASAEAVEAAAAALASAGDAAGEAKAHSVHALVLAQLGKIGACEAALDKALAAARRAHDRRRANAVLAGAPVAALWGPSPVTRASGRCLDVVRVLRITQGAPAVEAVALRCQAVLETLRGRAEAARRMIASSRKMVEELGIWQRVLEADLFAGLIELLEGDAAAAERCLRTAYDGLRAQGLGIDAAQAAALLGRALLAQGRVAEAEAISIESESLAGDSFKSAIAWRGVRAEALAARGEHAAAVEFAGAAVEIAAATDDLLDHADARQALAVALRAAGRSAEAGAEEKRAIELWEAKGATLLAERARRGPRGVGPLRSPIPSSAPAQAVARRVCPNAATALMARSAAAIEARDAEAVAALHSDAAEYVDHISGVSYGREGFLGSLRSLSKARDLTFQQEPLAVLGDSLALARRVSSASGLASATFDVAAYEREAFNLFEVDGETRVRRLEIFAPDRLGNAIARLYERYAELLPEGPERTRAAETARSVTGLVGPAEPDRWAIALAPAVEFTDHRSVGLLGFGRGVDTVLRGMRTLLEVAEGVTNRIDEVLGLRSDAFLVRWTNLGTARAGGGVFERQYLQLFAFGSDGLATRMEWFDADRDADALARFDELRGEPQTKRRRVRPNAATAATERFGAAFATGDASAYADLFADDYDSFEHSTGAAVGREGVLSSLDAMLRSSGASFRYEHLATLGESLALSRRWWSSEATRAKRFDTGASEREVISAVEVDEHARFRWGEMFAPSYLGDAIVRLYGRYAELLPIGPERARAAATAQSVATWLQQVGDRLASVLAPAIRFVDHRPIGMGSARGAEAFLRGHRAQHELARDIVLRIDDVLALCPDALLVRSMTSGIDRTSGGAYERPLLLLGVFDPDGRLACVEWFAPDSERDALARFDELTATPPSLRRVRPNAATANAARLDAAIATKDADALPGMFADSFAIEDHQTGVAYDRAGSLATWRGMLRIQELRYRQEPLATLGDSLALLRQSSSGVFGGKYDAGAFDREELVLLEVDAQGRRRRAEIFASDHLGDAIVRLYERYAEPLPEGSERARAAGTARSATAMLQSPDLDRLAHAFAPGVESVDHRILGSWSAHGSEELLQHYRSLIEVAGDIAMCVYDVLCLQPDALLVRRTHSGTDRSSGGAYERLILMLLAFGSDGRIERLESFDADRDAEALARFDDLTDAQSKSARRVRPNAATANLARGEAAIAARDAGALPALFSDDYEALDHTTGTSWDRQGVLVGWRSLMNARDPRSRHEPLATLGDSLTLYRSKTSASEFSLGDLDIGAFEREQMNVMEVDAQGRRGRWESFAAHRLGDAVARLYERYAELLSEGPARTRAAATARSFAASVLHAGAVDLERLRAALAPALVHVDGRMAGLGTTRGADAFLRGVHALLQLSEGLTLRIDDLLDLQTDAVLMRATTSGTDRASGGAFERPFLLLLAFGPDGLVSRWDQFDLGREAEALARFDELTAGPPKSVRRVRPNAATANAALLDAAVAAGNADAFETLFADRVESVDHTLGVEYDRQGSLEVWRSVLKNRITAFRNQPLATLGDSLALGGLSISATESVISRIEVGAVDWENLVLVEADAQARRRRAEVFPTARLGDAIARLYERYAELIPDGPARARAAATARSVAALSGPISDARWAEAIAPAIEVVDHRLLATFSASGAEELLKGVRSWLELGVDPTMVVDEVLGLEPNALLSRRTHTGTDRVSGGVYERELIQLLLFGADGRVTRFELFDVGHEATAVARFDELAAGPQPVRRRVRPNAATAHAAREDAAFAARDAGAFATLYADEVEVVDHLNGATLDQSEHLTSLRRLLRAQDLTRRHEALATLGDALALCRMSLSAGGFARGNFDVGAYEAEVVILFEVDARGRCRRCEQLASDHLGDAVVRLHERFAELLPDGPERTRAAATARSAAALLGPFDPDRYAAVYAPAIEVVDRRTLGTMTSRGAEAHRQNMRSWSLLSDSTANRFEEILDLRSGAFLGRQTFLGTDRAGGGVFERPFILLWVFGSDGLLSRLEYFDGDREAEALARFDELTAESPSPAVRIENAATRSEDAAQQAWESNDWESLAALFSVHFRSIDRRPLMRLETDRDTLLAGIRPFVDARVERSAELLATRGERLALFRVRLRGSVGASGPSEVELLQVTEVDASGLRSAAVAFGPDELDAAYAELDERYASEAGPHASTIERMQRIPRAFVARDWEQLASMYADDYVMIDHRVLGWGTRSRDEALAQLRVMVDLAPDVMLRVDHFAINHRGTFNAVRWMGSREGGSFEIPFINVISLGPDGRIRRSHTYDLDQLDAARACFDALTAEPPALAAHIESAATRAVYGVSEAWASRDWKRLADGYVAGFRYSDRKRMTQMGELDRSQYLEFIRPLFEMSSSRLEHSVLATRGERLALARQCVDVADHNTGPSEIESVAVFEVDEHGQRVATIRFDAENLDAAYGELDARFLAGEAAPHAQVWAGMQEFKRAFAERDWPALAARCAGDLVVHDHRLLGWHSLHGPAAYLEALRSLVDLAPDTKLRIDHVTICEHGYLVITVWEGTREGGAYEDPSLMVAELDSAGRIRRFDQYDLERLDEARARLAELHADPLRIPPNAATRAGDRWLECVAAGDWEALRALCAPIVFEDRRRFSRTTGDCDLVVANSRVIADLGGRASRTLLASSGDRLALERVLWTVDDQGATSDVDTLQIIEVDAEGLVVAGIVFDADDRRAASAELLVRDPHGDAVKRAMSDHDLDRLRAALPDDFVLNDHRRTGLGQLGKDDYITSLAALFQQAPDVIIEPLYTIAAEAHASLSVVPMFGTLVDGGTFESLMLRLASLRGGEIARLELFEPEDLDAARARFAELRLDPLRIPPNLATRAMDRWRMFAQTRDWDVLTDLFAPTFVYEDRRRLVRDTGDRDKMIQSVRLASSSGARASHSLLATAGEHLALAKHHFLLLEGSTLLAEIETLQITEVDGGGRIVATITFDPEDRRAAFDEMQARFAAGEAAAAGGQAPVVALVQAFTRHDWEALRACLAPDAVVHDHRKLGVMGALSGGDWLESRRVLADLAPDVEEETLRILAWDGRGRVSVGRLFGVARDGGAFEILFVGVYLTGGDRVQRYEFFDVGDADRAIARFEELCAGPG